MGFLLGFLFALLLWILSSVAQPGDAGTESQACAIDMYGVQRCGPTMNEDGYQLPEEGEMIRSFVHTGPISPESQEGYEIVVDADGTVTITVTPLGASGDLAETERTAEEIVRTEEIGPAGVQGLLKALDGCGFYYMPQRGEFTDEDMPVGGSVSILEVRLDDGTWEVSQAVLETGDESMFEDCQGLLAKQFGVTAPT